MILNSEPAYILSPINLDAAIQELQKELKKIPWLTKVYGRARVISEKVNDKTVTLPKCYESSGEYVNVLNNDSTNASCWFQVTGPETPLDYGALNSRQKFSVPVSLIVWFTDLTKILKPVDDYYHLELPKKKVFNALNKYPNVEIQRQYDENLRDIFKEYTVENTEKTLTHPNAGLRFDFILTYNYNCE